MPGQVTSDQIQGLPEETNDGGKGIHSTGNNESDLDIIL